MNIKDVFDRQIEFQQNLVFFSDASRHKNQNQTNEVFSDKWGKLDKDEQIFELEQFQRDWFLKLYGYSSETELKAQLSKCKIILDAGCGLGYKAAWFASLAPQALVVGMDYSTSVISASERYSEIENLYFIQGDIATTGIKKGFVDFVVCDQVIMHTEDPEATFRHLSAITKVKGEFCCYVYRKKALPRELLDSYFRDNVHNIDNDQIWEMSEQLTDLGKTLADLNIKLNVPDIPLLGITGGEQDLQRFIYWNFIKCFWKEDWSRELNISTNFDWYSPSNAKRYSEEEFKSLIDEAQFEIKWFHSEEACYTCRIQRK